MNKTESIPAKEMDKIPCDLKMQTNHQILVRRPCIVLTRKKKLSSAGFCLFSGPVNENKRKRKDRQIRYC